MPKPQRRRHPAAPYHQRGEGSRADDLRSNHKIEALRARSLARLKSAVLRDDAIGNGAFHAGSR